MYCWFAVAVAAAAAAAEELLYADVEAAVEVWGLAQTSETNLVRAQENTFYLSVNRGKWHN